MKVDLGKVGEYSFAAELFKHGFVPLWPSAEAIPYDLVFLNSNNEAKRVQVKASAQKGRIDLDVGVRRKRGRGDNTRREGYTKADIDLLAIWAIEAGIWYIIPVEALSRSMSINPAGERCKWIPYKEAWWLLEE